MPTIIVNPTTHRANSRSMTVDQCNVYIRLMNECDATNNVVCVDDSTSSHYETTYARGEKIRNAIRKFKLSNRDIIVRSIKIDDQYVATIAFKS